MQEGSDTLREERRDDPSDDENDGKPDDSGDGREERVERAGQRGLESVTGVPHRDGDRCTLHNASTDFVGETKPETAWGGRHGGSVTKVTTSRLQSGLLPKLRRTISLMLRAFSGVRKRSSTPVWRFSLKVPNMG